jgi:hypothetical protein
MYGIEEIHCDCHPETCSHFGYQIVNDRGEPVASGDNEPYMRQLVFLANQALNE